MQTKHIISSFLLFFSLFIIASAQSGITDDNGFEYDYIGDGIYQISSDKGSTYLGFAISGNYNGNGFVRSFNNFTWNTPVETSSDIWTITESTGNWKTEFSFVDETKISNEITNPYPLPITNAKFYYLLSVDPGDKVRIGEKVFTVEGDSDYHFTDAQYNLNEIVPHLVINNIQMNYNDLLDNGFDITDLYLTNGDIIGYPDQKVIAVGFTKGTRTINPGQTVVVDPVIEEGFTGYTRFIGNNVSGNGTIDFNTVNSNRVDVEITNHEAGGFGTTNASNGTALFTNKKTIHINSSTDGPLNNYQINVTTDYESNMQSDFDDIRFNEINGSYINYWVESTNVSNSSEMWLKTNVPAAGGKDIYMYYGNASLNSESNIDDTFVFADDFNTVSEKMQATGLTRNEDAYSYYDKGANHFNDFNINFNLNFESQSGGGLYGVLGLTSSVVDDMSGWGTTDMGVFCHYDTGETQAKIWLSRGNLVSYQRYNINMDTTYFCTLSRAAASDTIVLKIYSNSDRTNLLSTLTETGFGTATRYRYIYGIYSRSSAQAYTATGYVSDAIIEGETKEDYSVYTEVDPNSHISDSVTADMTKWWPEYATVTMVNGTCKVERSTSPYHGSLIGNTAFSSGVCTWNIIETSACTSPFVVNNGICYPSIQTTGRDIWYWQTAWIEGTADYSKARIRINDVDIYTSTPEARCADEGRTSVYFKEGYVKLIKDGSIKVEQTNVSLTIPDGMKPFFGVDYDNVYTIADWMFIREYTPNPPIINIGTEEQIGEHNITVSVTGDTNTSTYNASDTKNIVLNPTAPISQIVFNTTSTDYSYNATLYWTQNTTLYSETAASGVYNQTVQFTPDENVTSGYINTTVNPAIFDVSGQDFLSQKYAYENDSTDVTSDLIVPGPPWSDFNLSISNLNAEEIYEWWFKYNYNNAPTVGTITNISTNTTDTTQFIAPSFSDPEGLGINSEIWYFGDGNSSTDHNPTNVYSSTGVYSANYSVTENATMNPQTVTRDFTVFVYDRKITCVLESRTPENLTVSSRGPITIVYNVSCNEGINADNIFITGTLEGNVDPGLPNRWSARPPPNNKSVSSGYVNDSILRAHGRNKGFWFEGLGIFNDTFSYAVFDKNSPYITITNYSNYAIVNMTWEGPPAAFRNQIYLEQVNQTDDGDFEIYKDNAILTKIWDLAAYSGTGNYTAGDEYSMLYNGDPDENFVVYYCNESYTTTPDPLPNGINMTGNTLLYHMDDVSGAIIDSSGSANDGTYSGTEYNQVGKVAESIGFDGNDDISFSVDTSLYGENVTVSAWVYWDGESGTTEPIISQTNPAGWGYKLYVDTVTDKAVFWLDNTGATSTAIVPKNQWTHIVGTHNETTLKVYVNTIDDTTLKSGSGKNFAGYIGYDSVGEYFNGRIDEVAVWGRTLNESEVDYIFHMGAPAPDIDDHNCAYLGAFDSNDIEDGRVFVYFGVDNGSVAGVSVTNTSYRYIKSECLYSSGQWLLDYSNGSTFTNISFSESNVSRYTTDHGGNFDYTNFTPIVASYSVVPNDIYYSGIYVENTFGDTYTNFSFVSDVIDDVNLNISSPSIPTVTSDFGGVDDVNDATVVTHAGASTQIRLLLADDPDAPESVNHTLYLLYPNATIYQTINESIYSSLSFVDIDFDTCMYPSGTYRLRVDAVADDNENDTQSFTTGNFSLLGNTPATAYNGELLGFVAATDIPTLYSLINNNSYMSYDAGNDTYTLHVTHYQVCHNDHFNFSNKVHLRSEYSADEAINYNWNGVTEFNNTVVTAWNVTQDSAAPATDAYRSSLISCVTASGNITNSSFYNLGSDVLDRDGIILVDFDDVTISNNTFDGNWHPLVIKDYSSNNVIEDNTILNSADNALLLATYSNYNVVRNNTINNSGAVGVYLYYASHNTLENNSVQNCDSYDYYFRTQCTNNTLLNPIDDTNEIRPTSSSYGIIENTDNQVFSHTSQYFLSTAHLNNFSLDYGGTSETFDIIQRNMTIVPSVDSILIENLNWTTAVTFNATCNTTTNPVWFNMTHDMWNNYEVEVFRNGSLYDTTPASSGTVEYNYTGGFSEWYFKFTPHEYNVSGYVKDTNDQPLENALVTDNRSIDSSLTNESGYYILSGYINGSHTLIASKEDYLGSTKDIVISGSDLTNQNITLVYTIRENRLPLSIFITWTVIMFGCIYLAFPRRDEYDDLNFEPKNFVAATLAIIIAFVNSKNILNGNIVQTFTEITSTDTVVTREVPVQIAALGYIFQLIGLIMVVIFISLIITYIKKRNGDEYE